MHKIVQTTIIILTLLLNNISAKASNIDSLVEKSPIGKNSTIAVSVKNVKTGRVIYEFNQHKLLNPASIQKVFTMRASYQQLGKDFVFETRAYTDNSNNLYIKLDGDPTLTTANLTVLLSSLPNKTYNDIVIDPFVFDNEEWGIGWMWDDNTSELLPKYSSFSVNENKISVTIKPSQNNKTPEIKNNNNYDIRFVNKLQSGTQNKIIIDRKPWQGADIVTLSGTVKSNTQINIPVNSPEKNFICELKTALKKANIKYTNILIAPTPEKTENIATLSSASLDKIIANTLKDSNNFYSEMIFKKASQNFTKEQGTTLNAVKMFNKYYNDLKSDKIIVVDGCGISRNNLITADWVTEALNKIYKEKDFDKFNILLAKPMEGTLSNRLLNLSLKIRAKTGTASNISSVVGYIETKNRDKYSFAIIIQNHDKDNLAVKNFEDRIINEIYND